MSLRGEKGSYSEGNLLYKKDRKESLDAFYPR